MTCRRVREPNVCSSCRGEVDSETGAVTLLKLTSAHDTCTVLNPLMHQGQIDGGTVRGMGYALMEQLVIEDGKVVTANFGDYKIPSIKDIPISSLRFQNDREDRAPTTV